MIRRGVFAVGIVGVVDALDAVAAAEGERAEQAIERHRGFGRVARRRRLQDQAIDRSRSDFHRFLVRPGHRLARVGGELDVGVVGVELGLEQYRIRTARHGRCNEDGDQASQLGQRALHNHHSGGRIGRGRDEGGSIAVTTAFE